MDKKARSQNWTEAERTSAVELILRNEDVIFGRFKGSTSGAKEKEKTWQSIADELNA